MIALGQRKIDPVTGRIFDEDGTVIPIRGQSAAVLKLLVARPDRIVSKVDIFDAVWTDRTVTDDSLVQCVSDIRRALGDGAHFLVETVPSRGYRLNLGKPEHDSKFVTLSLLMLPFQVNPIQEKAALHAAGLFAEIASELGRHRDLRVIAPTFVPEVQNEGLAARSKANLVLSGTMEEQVGAILTTVQLKDPSTNEIYWSQTWKTAIEDIYALRNDVLDRVAGTIASTWTGDLAAELRDRARSRPPASFSVYEEFLIGSFLKHQFTLEGFKQARPHLERAVELDPSFGRGWVALYFLDGLEGMKLADRDERLELSKKARFDASMAMKVAPEEPWSLFVGSIHASDEEDADQAGEMLKRAVGLAPSNGDLLAVSTTAAAKHSNLVEEPQEWVRRAHDLNPFPLPYFHHATAFAAFARGDFKPVLDIFKDDNSIETCLLYALTAADHLNLTSEVKCLADRFGQFDQKDVTVRELLHTQTTGQAQTELVVQSARKAGLPIG